MADKDAKLSQDTPPQDKPLDYNKDVHNVSLQDIFDEVADAEEDAAKPKPAVPDPAVTPTPPADAKPEDKTAAPTPPAEPAKETPAIDPEKLKEEISEATAKKLLDQLAPADATPAQKKEWREQLKELEAKAKAENRDFTYEEAIAFLHETVSGELEAKLTDKVTTKVLENLNKEVEAEEKNEAEKTAAAEKDKQTRYETLAKQWDGQLSELENADLLPKVTSNDPSDPARKERVAFLTAMQSFNQQRLNEGKPEVLNMVEYHALYYKSPNEQPAGAKAPVGGARRSVATQPSGEFSYADIHNKPLDAIIRGE